MIVSGEVKKGNTIVVEVNEEQDLVWKVENN
jgi:hypothetical protein